LIEQKEKEKNIDKLLTLWLKANKTYVLMLYKLNEIKKKGNNIQKLSTRLKLEQKDKNNQFNAHIIQEIWHELKIIIKEKNSLNSIFLKLKKDFKKDSSVLNDVLSESWLTKSELLKHFESKKFEDKNNYKKKDLGDFRYGMFLDIFWITEETEKVALGLIKLCLEWKIWKVKDKNSLLKVDINKSIKNLNNITSINFNIASIIELFLSIESSWGKNMKNINWWWASGYLQLHSWNGADKFRNKKTGKEIFQTAYNKINAKDKKDWKYFWWTSSIETAMNNVNSFYKDKEKPQFIADINKQIPSENKQIPVKERNKILKKIILNLTAEEQTIIWLIDFFKKIKKRWKNLDNLVNSVVWSQFDTKILYKDVHHTQAEEQWADKVLDTYMKLIWKMKILEE
jgi:hypothetical protein